MTDKELWDLDTHLSRTMVTYEREIFFASHIGPDGLIDMDSYQEAVDSLPERDWNTAARREVFNEESSND